MDCIKLFKDEALIEILELGKLGIDHGIMDKNDTYIYFEPSDQTEISKINLETILDFFKDYKMTLFYGSDSEGPYFAITDYK